MLDSPRIIRLYNNVLNNDMHRFNLSVTSVRTGIDSMREVYKPDKNLNSDVHILADYNDVAHRCAYLHKYAAFHTAMVRDMMFEAVRMNHRFFYDIIYSSERFNICCLGGGPGTDVIGVLAALHSVFSYFHTSVTLVDYMVDWSYSFESILRELGSGFYGAFGSNTYHFLDWRYLGANLLKPLLPDVSEAIGSASLVTMIKFASAAACVDTEIMLQNIFSAMKPGAVLLFIDNDGGGFNELITKVANENDFLTIYGPFRHENYTNESMKIKRFGITSCFKSTVTVHLLQKPPELPIAYSPPDCNYSYISPFEQNPFRRPLMEQNIVNYQPPLIIDNPLPFRNPVSLPGFLGTFDFAVDENILNRNNFHSPREQISQIPQHSLLPLPSYVATPATVNVINSPDLFCGGPAAFTPVGKSKGIRRKRLNPGCFPFKRLRQNLSRKFQQVKYRTKSLLHSKTRKNKN